MELVQDMYLYHFCFEISKTFLDYMQVSGKQETKFIETKHCLDRARHTGEYQIASLALQLLAQHEEKSKKTSVNEASFRYVYDHYVLFRC